MWCALVVVDRVVGHAVQNYHQRQGIGMILLDKMWVRVWER